MSANDYIRSLLPNAGFSDRPPPRNSRGLRADSSHPSPYTSNDQLYHGQITLRPPPNMTRVRASRSNQRSPDNISSETSAGGAGLSSNSRNTPSPSFSTRNGSGVSNGETQPRRKKRPRPPTRLQSGEGSVSSLSGTQNGASVGNTSISARSGSAGTGSRPNANRVRNDDVASVPQSSGMASRTERRLEPAVVSGLRTRRMSVGVPLQPGPTDFSRGASMRRRNVQEDLNPVGDQQDDSDLASALPPPSYLDTISPNTASRRVPTGSIPVSDPPAPAFIAIFDVPPPPISPRTPPQLVNSLTINTLATPPRNSVLIEPSTPSFPGAFPASPIQVISHSTADTLIDRQTSSADTATLTATNVLNSPPPSFSSSLSQAQNVRQPPAFSSPSAPVPHLRIVSTNWHTTVERPLTPPSPQFSGVAEIRTLWDRLADEGLSIEERLMIIGNNATESSEDARHGTEASGEDDRPMLEVVTFDPAEIGVSDETEPIERPLAIPYSTVVCYDNPSFQTSSDAFGIDASPIGTALPSTLVSCPPTLNGESGIEERSGSASLDDNSIPLREETSPVMLPIQADEDTSRVPFSSIAESVTTSNLPISDRSARLSIGSLDSEHTPNDVTSINLPPSHHLLNQFAIVSTNIIPAHSTTTSPIGGDLHASASPLFPSSSSLTSASESESGSESESDQFDCQSSSSNNLGISSQNSSRSPSPFLGSPRFNEQVQSPTEGERRGRVAVETHSSSSSSSPSPSLPRTHLNEDRVISNRLIERSPPPIPPPLQLRPQRRPPPPAPPLRVPRRTSLYSSPTIATSSTSLARLANLSSTSLPASAPFASTYRRPPPPPPPVRPSGTQGSIPPPIPSLSGRARFQVARIPPSLQPPSLPPRPLPPSTPFHNESDDSQTIPLLRPTLQDRASSGLSSLSSTSSEVSLDLFRRLTSRTDLCAQNESVPNVDEETFDRPQETTEVSDRREGNRGGREMGSLSSPERVERVRPVGPRSPRIRPITSNLEFSMRASNRPMSEVVPAETEGERDEDRRDEDGHVEDPAGGIEENGRRQLLPELQPESRQNQTQVEFEYTDLDLLVMSLDGSQQYEAATALTSFLGPAHPKGLTTGQIDALPHGQVIELSRRTTSKGKTKVKLSCPAVGARRVGRCSFGCLGTLRAGEWIVGLVICEHVGCEPCARSWLKEDASCPVCRKKVVS